MAIVVEVTPAPALDRFDALFARFYPDLLGLVYRVLGDRMETEDVLQETFLKLADDAPLQAKPEVEVGAWLRRVSLNLAFNRIRTLRRARDHAERAARLEPPAPQELDAAERHEEAAAVRRALAELPERQRECLLLRHSGYSYAEIAATLDIAIGSVGVLLSRAERAFAVIYRRHAQA
jgi:RNA polymerase sigma factor (sigma-70 family)